MNLWKFPYEISLATPDCSLVNQSTSDSIAAKLVAFKGTDSPLKYLKAVRYLVKIYLYRIMESHAVLDRRTQGSS